MVYTSTKRRDLLTSRLASRYGWSVLCAVALVLASCGAATDSAGRPSDSKAEFAGTWTYDPNEDLERQYQERMEILRRRYGEEHPEWAEKQKFERDSRDWYIKHQGFRLELHADGQWEMENGGGFGAIGGGKGGWGALPASASGTWSVKNDVIRLRLKMTDQLREDNYSNKIKVQVDGWQLRIKYATGRQSMTSSLCHGEVRLERQD